jgi:hypothetical protein
MVEGSRMKHLLIGIMVAMALAIIGPAGAQVPLPAQPQWPPAAYPGTYQYPFPGITPRDAYRQQLINRWELEQFEGPTPQALQGPSPDGGGAGRGTGE